MQEPTLSVKAIKNGTVIDHIPLGAGLNILRYFTLERLDSCITVGFNLQSKTNNYKDLIKIENVFFTQEHIQQIAFFAPQCTINIIKNFKVVEKITPTYPDQVIGIFQCPNTNCASRTEPVKSYFYVIHQNKTTKLRCHYCEKIYPFEWMHKS